MIDVIIPVFRGLAQTKRCIESVLASADTSTSELVVIDDATPEPALAAYLDTLRQTGRITLLRNESNLGFVASVNRGMALHDDRDVVLLNSDTEVANNWLERLRQCACGADDIGTVTPLSNNATICSYPFDGWAGGVPGTLGLGGLDGLIAKVNAGHVVDLPTAVGFCMFIRRACLNVVGPFDADRFGRGYGEENDFSLRASAAGWRNVLAADVFVFHEGNVSFGHERERLQRTAMQALLEVHPGYLEVLGEFSHRDPVRPLRHAVDRARYALGGSEREAVLAEQRGEPPAASRAAGRAVLHCTHSWDGGTRRWIDDFCAHDVPHRNLVLRSVSNRDFASWRIELIDPARGDAPLRHWDLECPIRATDGSNLEYRLILDDVLSVCDVSAIIVSSLVGHSLEALETGLPTAVVLHDLYPFCPAMFGTFGTPCSVCTRTELQRCMRGNLHNAFWHNTDAEFWLAFRADFADRLNRPWVRVAAPSQSAWQRWTQLLPTARHKACAIIPHGIDLPAAQPDGRDKPLEAAPRAGKLRLVVPGRLLPHKGLDLFADALTELLRHADILLLGCGRFGEPFRGVAGVTVVRHYERDQLARHVGSYAPDAALLLSVVPESFSYTLSEMLALGLPVIATRVGAFAERLSDEQAGLLVEPSAAAVVDAAARLSADRGLLHTMRRAASERPVRRVADMVADYRNILSGDSVGHSDASDRPARTRAIFRWLADFQAEMDRSGRSRRHVERLRDEAASRIDELERRLAESHRERDSLKAALDKAVADHVALRGSHSWRLTAPLRWLTTAIRRAGFRPAGRDDAALATRIGPKAGTGAADAESVIHATDGASPQDVRRALKERLQIPGASRVVFCDAGGDRAAAERLLALASTLARRQNDTCFVMADGASGAIAIERRDSALLLATRRLFLLAEAEASYFFPLGADVIVTERPESLRGMLLRPAEGGWPKVPVLAIMTDPHSPGDPTMSDHCTVVPPGEAVAALSRLLDPTAVQSA